MLTQKLHWLCLEHQLKRRQSQCSFCVNIFFSSLINPYTGLIKDEKNMLTQKLHWLCLLFNWCSRQSQCSFCVNIFFPYTGLIKDEKNMLTQKLHWLCLEHQLKRSGIEQNTKTNLRLSTTSRSKEYSSSTCKDTSRCYIN